jgi:hypothetical protein
MFGGAGGLIEMRAALLASRGFAAFALAFFAYEDLPANMDRIELEYFEVRIAITYCVLAVNGARSTVNSVCCHEARLKTGRSVPYF